MLDPFTNDLLYFGMIEHARYLVGHVQANCPTIRVERQNQNRPGSAGRCYNCGMFVSAEKRILEKLSLDYPWNCFGRANSLYDHALFYRDIWLATATAGRVSMDLLATLVRTQVVVPAVAIQRGESFATGAEVPTIFRATAKPAMSSAFTAMPMAI